MNVTLNRKAQRQLDRQNEPMKGRIITALLKLSNEPPEGDIKKLQGRDGYRVRVGDCRILFDIDIDRIDVFGIERRGQAYRKELKK
jgi:mRNA interferase RelE/StbE